MHACRDGTREDAAVWVLALAVGCATRPGASTPAQRAEPVALMPSTIEVKITPPPIQGGFRWEAETVARVVRTIEASLHALPSVVVEVDRAQAPPSVQTAPQSKRGPYSVSLSVVGKPDSVEIRTMTCASRGDCTEETAFASTESPEPAAAELAARIIKTVGLKAPEMQLKCVTEPPSADPYASLIAGRGAAVLYGLIEADEPGDRNGDPLERAIYIDPKMALAQWVTGRGRHLREDLDGAATALGNAHKLCPDHEGIAADLARVELDRGKRRDAVSIVDGLGATDDPRLVQLRLDAWMASGRLDEARTLGERASRTFPNDPDVAKVMAGLSRELGDASEYERWLRRWTKRANKDPEPVRQLITLLAKESRWQQAYRLINDLESRGAGPEARQWRVTLGLALGKYEDAAAAADAVTAARIRARAALEGAARFDVDLDDDPSPEAALARGMAAIWGGRPAQEALREAETALSRRPYWPEALALKADALQAMGRTDEAAKTRRRWQLAEPPEL